MVHFVGAGPGDPEYITIRGAKLIAGADVIIYAGSLVNPALLEYAKVGCRIYNSAEMTLEEVIELLQDVEEDVDYETCTTLVDDRHLDSFDIIAIIGAGPNAQVRHTKNAFSAMSF